MAPCKVFWAYKLLQSHFVDNLTFEYLDTHVLFYVKIKSIIIGTRNYPYYFFCRTGFSCSVSSCCKSMPHRCVWLPLNWNGTCTLLSREEKCWVKHIFLILMQGKGGEYFWNALSISGFLSVLSAYKSTTCLVFGKDYNMRKRHVNILHMFMHVCLFTNYTGENKSEFHLLSEPVTVLKSSIQLPDMWFISPFSFCQCLKWQIPCIRYIFIYDIVWKEGTED